MAISPGFIGNSTNGIGQGLAFVLPQSNTEKYAMQLGQQHAADLRAAAIAQQKQQQELQAQYQNDFAAQKLPEYWATAGKPINDAFTKYQQDAANYMAQNGKSPFGNPDFTKQFNDTVLLPARQSKEIEQAGSKLIPMIAADHDNKFTEDSKQNVLKWWDAAQKDPSSVFGQPIPQLQGMPSDINAFNKLIKPVSIKNDNGTISTTVPDASSMMQQAYVNSVDPRWNNLKKTQYGIDPELGDIGGVYNPQGKRVWYTNPVATQHITQGVLDNPTEPHNAEIITKLGIQPTDPYAFEKIQAAITKQNAGYGKFISDAGKYGSSLVNKTTDVTPDKYLLHLQQKEQFDKEHPKPTKEDAPTYFQDLSERMRTGVPGSGEELNQWIGTNPDYGHGFNVDNSNPSAVKITVPAKYTFNGKGGGKDEDGNDITDKNAKRKLVKPSYMVTLDSTNPEQWTAGLAKVYHDVTGEPVNLTKAQTPYGRGKVPNGMSATTNNTPIKLTKGSLNDL